MTKNQIRMGLDRIMSFFKSFIIYIGTLNRRKLYNEAETKKKKNTENDRLGCTRTKIRYYTRV